jgi:CRP-like cAMP-binding protein
MIAGQGLPEFSSLRILSQADFFSALTPPQLKSVAALFSRQEFTSGSQIYTLGDPAKEFYVLLEGMVRFNLTLGARHAPAGEIIRRGDVFGWAALIENAPRRIATASCITACTVLAVEGDRLLELMQRDHSIGYNLMKRLNLLVTSNLIAFAAG